MSRRSLNGLHQLGDVLNQLQQQQAEAAAQAARARLEQAQRQAQTRQFEHAVGPVTPMRRNASSTLAADTRPKPAPEAKQHEADERQALETSWSDTVDIHTLLLTDDGLAWRREQVSADVVHRLRRGQWAVQAHLDLHGLRRDAARDAVRAFLASCTQHGHRCVRVVHGKGHGSPGQLPVLKAKVQRWLAQSAAVLAFTHAPGPDGGAGALLVLLQGRQTHNPA